jgi:hypothetical protein
VLEYWRAVGTGRAIAVLEAGNMNGSLRFSRTQEAFPLRDRLGPEGNPIELPASTEIPAPPLKVEHPLHQQLAGIWLGVLAAFGLTPDPPSLPPAAAIEMVVNSSSATNSDPPPTLDAMPQQQLFSHEQVEAALQQIAAMNTPSAQGKGTLSPELTASIDSATQQLNAEADRTIDVVVLTVQPAPSEDEINDAKGTFRDIAHELHESLAPSALFLAAVTSLRDKGIEGAWNALKKMAERLTAAVAKSSSEPNPILDKLNKSFAALVRIFDLSSGAKALPIESIAKEMGCSEEDAEKILPAAPLAKDAAGNWGLDPGFGSHDPESLKSLEIDWQ